MGTVGNNQSPARAVEAIAKRRERRVGEVLTRVELVCRAQEQSLLVGVILLPAVLLTWFVLVIVAAIKASNGEYYRYPFTIRFIN